VRSLRMAASWQLGIPTAGQDINATAWRYLALCGDYDPDLFFPIGSSGPAVRQRLRAKAVCAECPVKRDCLEWAMATEQPYGVWGGLDEQEREELRAGESEDERVARQPMVIPRPA
jgi:WhiB family redox-sensing transcriptional regulator